MIKGIIVGAVVIALGTVLGTLVLRRLDRGPTLDTLNGDRRA